MNDLAADLRADAETIRLLIISLSSKGVLYGLQQFQETRMQLLTDAAHVERSERNVHGLGLWPKAGKR